MLRGLLSAQDLWTTILLQQVGDPGRKSADEVAAKYAADASRLVAKQGLSSPADVVKATVATVEEKQNWKSRAVRFALMAAGTTRAEARKKLTAAALQQIERQHLTAPEDMVEATVPSCATSRDGTRPQHGSPNCKGRESPCRSAARTGTTRPRPRGVDTFRPR